MKTGPTRRVGEGASALTRSGLVAVIGNGFLDSSFTSSSLVGSCMDASPSEGVCHVAVLLIREQYERASGQLDTQGAGEADVPRGGTHVHHVIAMGYLPAVRVDVPGGQRTRGGMRVQHYTDLLGLARLHLDIRPAHQSLRRFSCARWQAEVDL